MPLTLLAARAVTRLVPPVVHGGSGGRQPVLNPVVLAAAMVAALTFAVMIGSC